MTAETVRAVRESLPAGVYPMGIGSREGAALRDRVRAERARRTLEVGLAHGVSTLWICEALVEAGGAAHHLAIDPNQTGAFEGAGLRNLDRAGVRGLVELCEEPSELALPRLLAEGRRFDLAFVDGNHRFEGVFVDLVYAGRLLPERAVVFVDDTQLPGVRRAAEFCIRNLGWTVEDEDAEGDHHAWTVLRTGPADAYRRPYRDFVDFG